MGIGWELMKERKRWGLSRSELARRAGLNERTLYFIEHEQTAYPRFDTLVHICRVLGYDLRALASEVPSRHRLAER